jgi:vancomycin resistance protein YoaR
MRSMRRLVVIAVTLVLAGAGAGLAANALTDRIAPGVHAAGIDIGGIPAELACERLLAQAPLLLPAVVTVVGPGGEWQVTNSALGLTLDVDQALAEAWAVGRSGDVWIRMRSIATTAFRGLDIGWPRRAIDDRLAAFLDRIALETGSAAVDGDVAIGPDGVVVREPKDGLVVDRTRLEREIVGTRSLAGTIQLQTAALVPVLGESMIADARAAALDAYAPLRVVAGSEAFDVPAARIATTVRVERVTTQPEHLVVTLDGDAIAALADDIADRLDGPARSAVLVPGADQLTVLPGRDGVAVDRVLLRYAIERAIFQSAEDGRVLQVPAEIVAPTLTTSAAAASAASTRLLGGFTTFFPESPPRATNIGLAAQRFDGMVVAPGATFSFWDRIGEVSPRTGYVEAGAIIGGVSSSAIGGGLCQVSTTLFNAVARAGLRIEQRHPHDYYIERYPLGLDAAVFAPWVDLQWTNDTSSPITIRAAAGPTSVSFWLYGPPTGRTTTFLDPVQWNIRYPAASQPADPSHAPGYVVPGRDVEVTRIVLQDGVEVARDTWYSHYEPVWGGPAR